MDLFDGQRPGCLGALFRLIILTALFDWMQEHFGFGRGCSCAGVGCGLILLFVFICAVCSAVMNTDWFSFSFR